MIQNIKDYLKQFDCIRTTYRSMSSFILRATRYVVFHCTPKAHFFLKRKIRKKSNIKVVFMLYEVPFWKNEALYRALLKHERFIPAFWIIDNPQIKFQEIQDDVKAKCIEYVRKNRFQYYVDISLKELQDAFSPDYLFVVHPYDSLIPFKVSSLKRTLLCFIPYGYSNLVSSRVYGGYKLQFFHRVYLESQYIREEVERYMLNKAKNTRVTGLPMADLLSASDVAPHFDKGKKKIIWAPHWTIRNPTSGVMDTSTFLEYADGMLDLAKKYKDSVIFIFKPHPLLKRRLYDDEEWGKEKTDNYYRLWATGTYTRLSEGAYDELFKQSDAMMHDCGSFILEYILMDKPCLYLIGSTSEAAFNKSTLSALECYYKSHSMSDVERFVQNVIEEKDTMNKARRDFISSYLLPQGLSPCNTIINDLLNP